MQLSSITAISHDSLSFEFDLFGQETLFQSKEWLGFKWIDSISLYDIICVKGGDKSLFTWYSLRQQTDFIQVTCFSKCKSCNSESLNEMVLILVLVQRVGKFSYMEGCHNRNVMRNNLSMRPWKCYLSLWFWLCKRLYFGVSKRLREVKMLIFYRLSWQVQLEYFMMNDLGALFSQPQ